MLYIICSTSVFSELGFYDWKLYSIAIYIKSRGSTIELCKYQLIKSLYSMICMDIHKEYHYDKTVHLVDV